MKQKIDESQIENVERILKGYKELSHLKVRTLGDLLILDSMPDGKRYSHTRFRCLSKNIFRLEMPTRNKWEMTPFEGSLEDLLQMVIDQFPWTLASLE
jgi:hypothetical protein